MKIDTQVVDERAVSPVVGVALMIAITVILAAVIGAVVLGLGTGGVDTPQAQLQAEWNDDGNEVVITHNGGEPLPEGEVIFIVDDEDPVGLTQDLTTGESYEVGATEGTHDELTVIWEDPNSDSSTILESFDL